MLPTKWSRDSNQDLRTVTWLIHRQNHRLVYRRDMSVGDFIGKSQYIHTLSTLSSSISPSSPPSQLSPPKLKPTTHPSSPHNMIRLMEWWCILLTAKHGNILTVCILTFQLNQGTCVLSCVQTDSTHSGHLLLPIIVGRSYWRFITCHRGCVWGWSSCFYLWSYQVRAIRARI
jgi:hypothetical protein